MKAMGAVAMRHVFGVGRGGDRGRHVGYPHRAACVTRETSSSDTTEGRGDAEGTFDERVHCDFVPMCRSGNCGSYRRRSPVLASSDPLHRGYAHVKEALNICAFMSSNEPVFGGRSRTEVGMSDCQRHSRFSRVETTEPGAISQGPWTGPRSCRTPRRLCGRCQTRDQRPVVHAMASRQCECPSKPIPERSVYPR